MARRNLSFVDDMVDVFGYDYVIGYCLCSAYNLKNLAEKEDNADKKEFLLDKSKTFTGHASRLTRERMSNGL